MMVLNELWCLFQVGANSPGHPAHESENDEHAHEHDISVATKPNISKIYYFSGEPERDLGSPENNIFLNLFISL